MFQKFYSFNKEYLIMQKILKRVLKKISPTEAQKKKMNRLSKRVLIVSTYKARKFNAEPILAGSLTRNTWLPDKTEFDVFIIFPKEFSEEQLEKHGLELGKGIVNELKGKWGIEYAQHPYVRATIQGIQVDIVPCYNVESGEKIKSAVDRTPLHVRYLNKHLKPEMADDVRLLKQLLKANGVYGADTKTQGFSGYICELLVIKYRTFNELLKAAVEWKPGEIIDTEKYWEQKDYRNLRRKFKNEALIIIDPVDRNRNAAAAISAANFYKFKKAAKDFLKKPSPKFFSKKKVKPLTKSQFKKHMKMRGTEMLMVKFKPPEVVPDILWPQLRKTTKRLENILKGYEFYTMRSGCWTDESKAAAIILELEVSSLPEVNKRVGPFVFDYKQSKNFIQKYQKVAVTGPFVEEDYWCVEVKRPWKQAKKKLMHSLGVSETKLKDKGIPNHIAKSIAKGFQVTSADTLLKNKKFAEFMRTYFEKEKLV